MISRVSRPTARLGTGALAKLEVRIDSADTLLCVGLDSDVGRLPPMFADGAQPQLAFNRWIIEQTLPYAAAFKPNLAFYEARGARGWDELAETMALVRSLAPDVFTIADAKRADIGSTNAGYVRAIFDELGFDAVTLHPYLGREALAPFLERTDRASIILARTSNPGAGELQDLAVGERPLWEVVAERVRDDWNGAGNCMLVVGATYPGELARARALCPDMTFLVPGVGAQGGDVEAVVAAGLDARGRGLLINASRSIIFADDPAAEAHQLRDAIRAAVRRQRA
jgi:orotidine-5'-phosphate decarboxylase